MVGITKTQVTAQTFTGEFSNTTSDHLRREYHCLSIAYQLTGADLSAFGKLTPDDQTVASDRLTRNNTLSHDCFIKSAVMTVAQFCEAHALVFRKENHFLYTILTSFFFSAIFLQYLYV